MLTQEISPFLVYKVEARGEAGTWNRAGHNRTKGTVEREECGGQNNSRGEGQNEEKLGQISDVRKK